jgi:hypothetical protein
MLMVNRLDNGTIPHLPEPDQALFCAPVDACPRPDSGASAMTEESHRFA